MGTQEERALVDRVQVLERENREMLEELNKVYPELDRMRVAITEMLKIKVDGEAGKAVAVLGRAGLGQKVTQ